MRGLRKLVVVFLLVVLAGLVAWGGIVYSTEQQIRSHQQALRDMGYPATAEELNEWYAAPAAENAWDYYKDVSNRMEVPQAVKATLPIVGEYRIEDDEPDSVDAGLEAMRAFRQLNDEVYDDIYRGAAIAECRTELDATDPASIIPGKTFRDCARMLAVDSLIGVYTEDEERVLRALETGFALGQHQGLEPLIISMLVKVAVDGLMFAQFSEAVRHDVLSADSYESLQSTFAEIEASLDIKRAFLGETCYVNSQLSTYPRQMFSQFPPVIGQLASRLGWFDRWRLANYRDLRTLLEAELLPLESNASRLADLVASEGRFSPFNALTESQLLTFAQQMAKCRMARVVCDLERYRLRNGGYPSQLIDYVPASPFNGEPVEYVREGGGYILRFEVEGNELWNDDNDFGFRRRPTEFAFLRPFSMADDGVG